MKYPLSIRIIHWLMAAIIIGLLCVGLIMTRMSDTDPLRGTLFMLHKSFGIIIFLLFIVRVLLRTRMDAIPLPDAIPAFERSLSHLGHYTLYAFMLAMPISGFFMSQAGGYPVKFFGVVLPQIIEKNKDLGHLLDYVHDYGAYTLIGLLVLHVGAIILHRVKQRVNLLERMV